MAEQWLDSPAMVLEPAMLDLADVLAAICDEAGAAHGRDIRLGAFDPIMLTAANEARIITTGR